MDCGSGRDGGHLAKVPAAARPVFATREGIVAKLVDGRYRPGERGWVKIKNRAYWRYEMERESAIAKRRQRMFV